MSEISPVEKVPVEILINVFELLEFEDLIRVSCVCKLWSRVVRSCKISGDYPELQDRYATYLRSKFMRELPPKVESCAWWLNALEFRRKVTGDIRSILCIVCEKGYLEYAQLLVKVFNFATCENGSMKYEIFRCAYETGNIHVAKWLHKVFSIAPEQIRKGENFLLRWSRKLEQAQWLVETFGLTASDARSCNNRLLRNACEYGHLKLAQWLVKKFGLNIEDARSEDNEALRHACKYNYFDVVQWLVITFGLTTEDARSCNNSALRNACMQGNLQLARWLVSTFELTAMDAGMQDGYILGIIRNRGHRSMERWLRKTFRRRYF